MTAARTSESLAHLLAASDIALCGLTQADALLDMPISGLCHDSRLVRRGELFFALEGRLHAANQFVQDAVARGAAAVVSAKPLESLAVPNVVHPQPRLLMGRMAQRFYRDPAATLTLVAITGTNGKTTTAHLVACIMASCFGSAGLLGTLGTASVRRTPEGLQRSPYAEGQGLTTPEAPELLGQLARLRDDGIKHVVLEASSIALCEKRLLHAPVDVAALTNITQDHLDYHGTMDAYRKAKALLFTGGRKPHGATVWPRQLILDGVPPPPVDGPLLTFAAHKDIQADVQLLGGEMPQQPNPHGQAVLQVTTPRGQLQLQSPLFGTFNDENVLTAVAVAEALNIDHASIQAGLKNFVPVPGRLEPITLEAVLPTSARPLVLVDFAHTPDALARVLGALRARLTANLHLVIGCGGDRDPHKRPLMGQVAAQADRVYITSDNPRSESPQAIAQAMVQGLSAVPQALSKLTVQLDRRKAIEQAVAAAGSDDVVLVAGKGHEPYQIIAGVKHPFSDGDCARAALATWQPQNKRKEP